MVVIVVGIATPVVQLRVLSITKSCCCPDNDHCHCPKPKPDCPGRSTAKPCHDTTVITVSAQPPTAVAAAVDSSELTVATVELDVVFHSHPHAPPPPEEPFGPS